ncbi:MAG: 1-acyl-sn-glycerol-3-phosphate acyltransferase [Chloroflexia bacterium]|nr:1-acyl-sn-glycerol-3-phosphate acyltransferase [Chloroflexia bacterium]
MGWTPVRDDLSDVRRGTLHGFSRAVVRWLLLRLAGPLTGLRVEGVQHVPASGPVIVVANHLHNADPVLLAIAFPRPLYVMAKRELFAQRWLAAVLKVAGAFPVDRGKADRYAIRYAEAALSQGQAVAMFPEGTRSVSGRLGAGQAGVGLIALRSGAPLLPAAITGTESLPGNGAKRGSAGGRRQPAVIRFGAPFVLPAPTTGARMSSQEATERIMAELAAVLPAPYRP